MKSFVLAAVAVALIVTFYACSEDDDPPRSSGQSSSDPGTEAESGGPFKISATKLMRELSYAYRYEPFALSQYKLRGCAKYNAAKKNARSVNVQVLVEPEADRVRELGIYVTVPYRKRFVEMTKAPQDAFYGPVSTLCEDVTGLEDRVLAAIQALLTNVMTNDPPTPQNQVTGDGTTLEDGLSVQLMTTYSRGTYEPHIIYAVVISTLQTDEESR